MQGRDAQGEGVADRARDRPLDVDHVVAAIGDRAAGAEFLARPARHQLQRTADGVLAVQGALGSAQDLDALQIEQVELGAADAAVIDVIDIDADSGIEGLQGVRLAHAADVDVGRVGRGSALNDIQVRHQTLQIGGLGRAGLVEGFAREGAQRQRRALRGLFGPASGYDDVIESG